MRAYHRAPTARRLKLTVLCALAVLFLSQPPQAPGQNLYGTTGKWDFLYHGYYNSPFDYMEGTTLNPRPVRWREHHWGFTTSLFAPYNDASSPFRDFESAESVSLAGARERAREIRDTFGVHAVLLPGRLTLPESGGQQEGRGTVMLIGRGDQSRPFETMTVYTHSWNAHLLWRHAWDKALYPNAAQRHMFGFIGYSRDWQVENHSEFQAFAWSSNLFCSGHTVLDDGRLFVAGGSYHPPGHNEPTHGLYSLFAYNVEQWRNFSSTNNYLNQAGWKGSAAPSPDTLPTMSEKRWYASPLLLQDGSALVVGGIDNTGGSFYCVDQTTGKPRFTRNYDLYHPHTNQLTTYFLDKDDSCSPPHWFTNFNVNDERPALGNEYPRLHLVSFLDGQGQATSRATYNGPLYPVYVLNSHQKVPGCAPEQSAWDWKRKVGNGPGETAYPTITRSGLATVLLPRRDGSSNPQSVAGQTLNQVARIGGNQACAPHAGDDFARVYTYEHSADHAGSHHTKTASAPMGSFPPGRPGAKYPSAVLLPTGDLFVGGGMKHANDAGCAWQMGQHVRYESDLVKPSVSGGGWTGATWSAMEPMSNADIDQTFPLHNETHANDYNRGLLTPDGARMYHSTMILLPDGRILATGTDMDSHEGDDAYWNTGAPWPGGVDPRDRHRRARNLYPTIFSPPYLFKVVEGQHVRIDDSTDRPRITAQTLEEADYGQTIGVSYALPSGRQIQSAHLVRPGSVTHSVDFDQRLVRLNFSPSTGSQDSSGTLTVTMPWSPHVAPPGWYMLFLVDTAGVPSIATWVRAKPVVFPQCDIEEPGEMEFQFEGSEGESELTEEEALDAPAWRELSMPPVEVQARDRASGLLLRVYRLSITGVGPDGLARSPLYSTLPTGRYEFYIPPQQGYLGKRFEADLGPGARAFVALRSGDANGDDVVDSADLALATAQIGRQSDRRNGEFLQADLNKDGQVDAADVEIALRNLGRRGDR